MKKILILAHGSLARYFIQKIIEIKYIKTKFIVISYEDLGLQADNMEFFVFDPTHEQKLEKVFSRNQFLQAFIILDEEDTILAHKALKKLDSKLHIITCSNQDIDDNQTDNLIIDELLGHRLVSMLQDTPTTAQSIGLGKGEIMQMKVPVGSSYAYKHIEVINQRQFKIALIYRNEQIIIPKRGVMIYPNDTLLLVGQPHILLNEFLKSKKQLGQFPNPYGNNICLIIDKLDKSVDDLLNTAMLFHLKTNSKKLCIKVLNPTYNKYYEKLSKLNTSSINVRFFYQKTKAKEIIKNFADGEGGLFVVDNKIFKKHKKDFYLSDMPVLKIGSGGFMQLRQSLILKDNFMNAEDVSVEFLDLSKLLGLKPIVDCYMDGDIDDLKEHFMAMSSSYKASVKVIKSKENPLLKYKNSTRFLHFVPFYESIVKNNTAYIKNDLTAHHSKLDKCFQLFIPA